MKEKIEQYIKQIELEFNKGLITEIFSLLISLNTNDILGVEDKLASLFCRVIEKLQNSALLDEKIEGLITKAFNNIDTMPLNNEGTSELKTLYLLKILSGNHLLILQFSLYHQLSSRQQQSARYSCKSDSRQSL